jgi:hypothetical protein
LLGEVYAFPGKGGGIQVIVGVDGWFKLANDHPQFDGIEFVDHCKGDKIDSITAKVYRKDRSHPVCVTEYLSECTRGTEPWKKWPRRMLRHKAAIQAFRIAFSFSGVADPDEAGRYLPTNNMPKGAQKDEGMIVESDKVVDAEIIPDEKPQTASESVGKDLFDDTVESKERKESEREKAAYNPDNVPDETIDLPESEKEPVADNEYAGTPEADTTPQQKITQAQIRRLFALYNARAVKPDWIKAWVEEKYASLKDMDIAYYDKITDKERHLNPMALAILVEKAVLYKSELELEKPANEHSLKELSEIFKAKAKDLT